MKIFLIISNNYFYNNYLKQNILKELNNFADIEIISNKGAVDDKKKIVTNFIHEKYLNQKIHYIIATILMYLNEKNINLLNLELKLDIHHKKFTKLILEMSQDI